MAHRPKNPRHRLLLLVSCQQSITASPSQVDHAVATLYAPLLDALAEAPNQRIALHIHGYLLDRLARAHEGFLLRLKDFVARKQVEIVGGLFYGGPPGLLPESDVRGQVAMAGEFWTSFVGEAPRGIYLPELAWAPELPRLLEDGGIDYAFAATDQLLVPAFLSRIERGGLPLVTFGLDATLGRSFAAAEGGVEAAWIAAAVAATAPQGQSHLGRPVALHVGCEDLGAGVPTGDAQKMQAACAALFAAISAEGGETHLPSTFVDTPPPLRATGLTRGYAPWWPQQRLAEAPGERLATAVTLDDWTAFPELFAEAQVLYCRMLRASERLAFSIARMEDKGLDATWSDALATAQRLIFAAQSTEALGTGRFVGVLDPEVRRAVLARIIDAERLLETLVYGDAPFVEVQEADIDRDMQADVLVQSPLVTAWLQPHRGGAVRALDHRGLRLNVLDAGTRRAPLAALGATPNASTAIAEGAAPEAAAAGVHALQAGNAPIDVVQRTGLRCAWFAADASMDACVLGQAADLLAATYPTGEPGPRADALWRPDAVPQTQAPSTMLAQTPSAAAEGPDVQMTAALPPEDAALTLRCQADLGALGQWQLMHAVTVPANAWGLTLRSHWQRQGPPEEATPSRWAVEIPLYLGAGALRLEVNGTPLAPGAHTLEEGAAVTIVGELATFVLRAESLASADGGDAGPTTLWFTPLTGTLSEPQTTRTVHLGASVWLTRQIGASVDMRVSLQSVHP